MAIIANPLTSSLRIMVQIGVDNEGKPLLKTRTFNRVKTAASDENAYQFATSIAGLQKHSLYSLSRVNKIGLEEI